MGLRSKIFLLLAALCWGLSYTRFGSETLHGIPKPLGAVFFGLFLITWILPRRDFDQFKRDQALRDELMTNERKARRRRRMRSGARWKPHEAHP